MTSRILFETELAELKKKLVDMSHYALDGYERLVAAMLADDYDTLRLLQENDRTIVEMQRSVEADCLHLMTKQQPVAGDLRLISAVLKSVSHLERIGDHVIDIAEILQRRECEKQNGSGGALLRESCGGTLVKMFQAAFGMLEEAVKAFASEDVELAEKVIAEDDVVDEAFQRVKVEMMEAICTQTMDADQVVDNLMLAKYLEKMGDHAVGIARWGIFRVTGDMEGKELY